MILTICTFITCAGTAAPIEREGGAPQLTSDSTRYVALVDGANVTLHIGYRYINRTDGTVYIPGCGGPSAPQLEFLRDTLWVQAYAPINLMCRDSLSFSVSRGATLTRTLVVRGGPISEGAHGEWSGPLPGTYRLVLSAYASDSIYAAPLPLSARISNTFQIDH